MVLIFLSHLFLQLYVSRCGFLRVWFSCHVPANNIRKQSNARQSLCPSTIYPPTHLPLRSSVLQLVSAAVPRATVSQSFYILYSWTQTRLQTLILVLIQIQTLDGRGVAAVTTLWVVNGNLNGTWGRWMVDGTDDGRGDGHGDGWLIQGVIGWMGRGMQDTGRRIWKFVSLSLRTLTLIAMRQRCLRIRIRMHPQSWRCRLN